MSAIAIDGAAIIADGTARIGSVLVEGSLIAGVAYAAEDRTGEGGGLAGEHENITVVEMPLAELRDRADRNALDDMKTLCLVQTLRLRRPDLFT